MADDKQPRRVKVTGAAAHHAGTLRAAVKPHKKAAEASAKQVIEDYMKSLRAGSVSHTIWGDTVAKNAKALRNNFGLAATDEPYLLLDAGDGTGRAGMVLSTTGVHVGDGRGKVTNIGWGDLGKISVGYQRGMLVIGQTGIVSTDAQAMVTLLQKLQTKLAK